MDEELVKLIAEWRADPIMFFKTAFTVEVVPEPWQEEFFRAVAKHNKVSVKSGNRVGKTMADSLLILWWLFTQIPSLTVVIGPSEAQISNGVWKEVGVWYSRLKPFLKELVEYQTGKLFMKAAPQECYAVVSIANKENPNAMQGRHCDNIMCIFDEAAGIDDIVFEYTWGVTANPNHKIIFTGNPNVTSGLFYRTHEDPEETGWYTMTVSALNRAQVTAKQVPDSFIDEIKQRFRHDPNAYRWKVIGEFPLESDEGVISLTNVQAAINREVTQAKVPFIWGLDVAQKGKDRTVLVKRKGNIVHDIKIWQGKDTWEIASLVSQEYSQTKEADQPAKICVDTIGVGQGVYDQLWREYYLPAKDVKVSRRALNDEQYVAQRDELWFRAAAWFAKDDCQIPDNKEFIQELVVPTYTLKNGRYKVESKDEIRSRGRRSPDLADAFCLTFAVPHEEQGRQANIKAHFDIDYGWVT